MKIQFLISALASVVLITISLQGAVGPGHWEKVDALEKGTAVLVTMNSGDRLPGVFQASDAENLFITDVAGQGKQIPKTEVTKVVRPPMTRDSPWNGAKIGAAAGFAGGVVVGLRMGDYWGNEEAVGIGIFGPIGAAVGFLTGYLIDKARPSEEVLYQAK